MVKENIFRKKILPFEFDQNIQEVPAVDLPTRQKTLTFTLGTVSHNVQCINKKAQTIGDELKEKAQEEIDKQDIDVYFQPISVPQSVKLTI